MAIPFQKVPPNCIWTGQMIACVHLTQKKLVPPDLFPTAIKSTWQPQSPLWNLFYLSCQWQSGSVLVCTDCFLSLLSPPDVSTKAKPHGLICTAVSEISDSNDICLQSPSVSYLYEIYLQWKYKVPWRAQFHKVVVWFGFNFKNVFVAYIIVIPLFTILSSSRSFLSLVFMLIATHDRREYTWKSIWIP